MTAENLAEARSKLFRSWTRDSYSLRKPLVEAYNESVKDLDVRISADGTKIKPSSLKGLTKKLDRTTSRAFQKIEVEIQQGVERAIRRTTRAQLEHLRSIGAKELSRAQVLEIQKSVMKELGKEFPKGSGLNFRDRILRVERHHQAQMRKVLKRTHSLGDGVSKISREMKTGLTHIRPGRTPLVGGSATKNMQRIMVAEETRMAHIVEQRLAQASGIELAYWRLSSVHPNYGGNEICDFLAKGTGDDVAQVFRRNKVAINSLVSDGLYTIRNWPSYPHPFCKCYMEMVLTPTRN